MAYTVVPFQITIPASTPQATPQVTDLTLPPTVVETVRWRVPKGPRGQMGWALTMGGQWVIPYGTGTYVVADDETDDWTIEGLPDSGAWQLTGYNTGNFPHTVYLYFFTTPIDRGPSGVGVPVPLIPAAQLNG